MSSKISYLFFFYLNLFLISLFIANFFKIGIIEMVKIRRTVVLSITYIVYIVYIF